MTKSRLGQNMSPHFEKKYLFSRCRVVRGVEKGLKSPPPSKFYQFYVISLSLYFSLFFSLSLSLSIYLSIIYLSLSIYLSTSFITFPSQNLIHFMSSFLMFTLNVSLPLSLSLNDSFFISLSLCDIFGGKMLVKIWRIWKVTGKSHLSILWLSSTYYSLS